MATLDSGVRSSLTELNEVIDSDRSDDFKKQALNMGMELVDQHLDSALSDADLKRRIEVNLAAHFLSVTSDKAAGSMTSGDISADFMVEGGKGLSATGYGQMAMSLDPSGNLRKQDQGGLKTVTQQVSQGGGNKS